MKTTHGNLIDLAEEGKFDVIIHGCNCFHTMGAGIAKQIAERYPEAFEVDLTRTQKGDTRKLGKYTYTRVTSPQGNTFGILNAYTQFKPGRQRNEDLNQMYLSMKAVFGLIKENFPKKKIGYPRIGSGIAGGDWKVISDIIDSGLSGMDHTLVVFNPYSGSNFRNNSTPRVRVVAGKK